MCAIGFLTTLIFRLDPGATHLRAKLLLVRNAYSDVIETNRNLSGEKQS